MTLGITHFSDVYKGERGTFDAMGQQLAGLAKQNYGKAAASFSSLVSRFHLGAEETKNLLRVMPAYREELIAHRDKNHIAATDTNLLASRRARARRCEAPRRPRTGKPPPLRRRTRPRSRTLAGKRTTRRRR
jgi:uncharacterized protein YukE